MHTDESTLNHAPGTEPIPGYRLIEPLGRGGFAEVWKCEAPGGLLKAIKFVHGNLHALDQSAPADEELRAIQRVKTIRHPFILSMERVEIVEGELVIVFELADQSLADVLLAAQAAGRPGIPRDQLLRYLGEAAEALDVIHSQHDLQHLDIKPQNLFLVSNHVKVGDFGLVRSLSAPARSPGALPAALTPRYAAPEVSQGVINPHSDQYSLAVVYQELLTGSPPFTGKNSRQLMLQHASEEPDLGSLPEIDRAVLRRALSKDPGERFPCCTDFVHALVTGQSEVVTAHPTGLKSAPELILDANPAPQEGQHFRFGSVFPPHLVLMRLAGFERQWNATIESADARGIDLHMQAPRCIWQRWTGEPPVLKVRFEVIAVGGQTASGFEGGSEVHLYLSPRDCPRDQSAELLEVVGPLLAESVRTHLRPKQTRRTQERLPWLSPIRLCEILPDGSLGPAIDCQGKDISLDGIGFYIEGRGPTSERVLLHLPKSTLTAEVSVKARVVRVKGCGNGWYEVGAVLETHSGSAQCATHQEESNEAVPAPVSSEPLPRRWRIPRWVAGVAAAVMIGISLASWSRSSITADSPARTAATIRPGTVARPLRTFEEGQPEVADLASEIAAAPDGGVVLVRGRVRCAPLRVTGKSLTLRGVPGSGPVLERLDQAGDWWEALISSDRPLTIEGLELRGTKQNPAALVCVTGATLTMRDCKLTMSAIGPAVTLRGGGEISLRGCEVNALGQALAVEVLDEPCRILARDCRMSVRDESGAMLLAWSDRARTGAVDVELEDSTVEAGRVLACRSVAGPVRVVTKGSRLDVRGQRVSYSGYHDGKAQPKVSWLDLSADPPITEPDRQVARKDAR